MELCLWACIGIMAVAILALLLKIRILQTAAREIETAFADRLMTDTNTLIDISSNDKYMRHLASSINQQLRKLRKERQRFQQGDAELKNAVTNISHDLRTPLTAILGYLDLLEQEESSAAVKRYAAIIRNRAEIMTQLTEELFRYSVIISAQKNMANEPVVLNHALEESLAALYAAFQERGITPKVQMPEDKIVRVLDRSALSRVLANLLSNAMKYSDGDLDICLSSTGEITFANTASGLDEIQLGRLFDRFYTVEAAQKSTGLGLAISKTLIEQMNGTISAKYEDHRLSICIRFSSQNLP